MEETTITSIELSQMLNRLKSLARIGDIELAKENRWLFEEAEKYTQRRDYLREKLAALQKPSVRATVDESKHKKSKSKVCFLL